MTPRPKLGRRRRNLTLEELLTSTASDLRHEIAPNAKESRKGCTEATVSQTLASRTEKSRNED